MTDPKTPPPQLTPIQEALKSFWKENRAYIIGTFKEPISQWPEELEDKTLSETEFEKKLEDISILILTANSVEANMMVRLLSRENNESKIPAYMADQCWYRFGQIAGINVVHVQPLNMSSFTPHGSHRSLEDAFKRVHPKLVVSLGVAFGANEKGQQLGDVLVSEELCAYDALNKRRDGELTIDKKGFYQTDLNLMCAWKNPLSCSRFPLDVDDKRYSFDWHCGLMLSGGTVLSDSDEKKKLLEEVNHFGYKCVGGEMEGNGVYYSCTNESVPCVVIKGICDWGAEKNAWKDVLYELGPQDGESNDLVKDCIQALAMRNAFLALKYLIKFSTQTFFNNPNLNHSSSSAKKKWDRRKAISLQLSRLSFFHFVIVTAIASFLAISFLVCTFQNNNFDYHQSFFSWFFFSLILFCSSIVYLLSYVKKYFTSPEKLTIDAANILIEKLDFSKCYCEFRNASDASLINLKMAWISKRHKNTIRIHKYNKLKPDGHICVAYQSISENDLAYLVQKSRISPIIPDTLQIEYDYHEKRYYHLFKHPKEQNGMLMYSEFIYMRKNGVFRKIHGHSCSVPIAYSI